MSSLKTEFQPSALSNDPAVLKFPRQFLPLFSSPPKNPIGWIDGRMLLYLFIYGLVEVVLFYAIRFEARLTIDSVMTGLRLLGAAFILFPVLKLFSQYNSKQTKIFTLVLLLFVLFSSCGQVLATPHLTAYLDGVLFHIVFGFIFIMLQWVILAVIRHEIFLRVTFTAVKESPLKNYPEQVRRYLEQDDTTEKISWQDIRVGDILVVKPGEVIPRDAVIIKGTTSVDERVFFREGRSVLKAVGDLVLGGSLNRDSVIFISVHQAPEQDVLVSLANRIEKLDVESTAVVGEQFQKPLRRLHILTGVLAFAVAAANIYFLKGPAIFSMTIVSGFFFSLVAHHYYGMLVQNLIKRLHTNALACGIWFSHARIPWLMAKVKTIFFTKSGTLTLGDLVYSQHFIEPGTNQGQMLSAAFSLEKNLSHPLAKAMLTHPWYVEIPQHPIDDLQVIPGLGVSGRLVPRGGRPFFAAVGNLRFMKRHRFMISREMRTKIDEMEDAGETVVLCGFDRAVRGIFGFSDILRKDVGKTLKNLVQEGFEVGLLTGDTEKNVLSLTGTLGMQKIYSRLSPEEKRDKILKEKPHGAVALVSNDGEQGESSAAADVTIVVDQILAQENAQADVVVYHGQFNHLAWVFAFAKKIPPFCLFMRRQAILSVFVAMLPVVVSYLLAAIQLSSFAQMMACSISIVSSTLAIPFLAFTSCHLRFNKMVAATAVFVQPSEIQENVKKVLASFQ